jgi:prepilin-type N-terminal cleavage/methylation domain-containing protein
MKERRRCAFTLVELMVVIGLLALLIAFLLPMLSRIRKSSLAAQMEAAASYRVEAQNFAQADAASATRPVQTISPAMVKSFTATVDLTPRLSVGTAEPESIYQAGFKATIEAAAAVKENAALPVDCEILLPLPPQIISLADLSVTVNGEPSDSVLIRESNLVWTGKLAATGAAVQVTYTAVGKGLYTLQTPPGRILDTFNLELTANGSDVRMLELSLQPTQLSRTADKTQYIWNYKRLMFGRPIALDVLGIAPIDRLGELRWIGPLSVVIFGLIVGLYAHAFSLVRFDRWMLLMILGAFTGAYPLMYFAQEFVSLRVAIFGSAAIVLFIIALRGVTIVGVRHGLLGIILPAMGTMALALVLVTRPQLQGILLTGGAIVVFVVAMMLIPRLKITAGTAVAMG